MSKRILNIDDDPSISKIVKTVLAKEGYDVVTYSNPEEGLDAAIQGGFDLYILDVMMPGMDGYQICNKIKTNPSTAEVPVIFLTAKSEMVDMLHGYFQGAQMYLSKPFTSTTLLEKVKEIFGESE